MHQRNVEAARGRFPPPSAASPLAQQTVVDKNAGKLVTDRFVDQHRRDGTVDAAGTSRR